MRLLFSDAHCRSNPILGLGAGRITKRFRDEGGWFLALIGLPPHHYDIEDLNIDAHLKAYRIVIRDVKRGVEACIRTSVLIGFHPAEIDRYFRAGCDLEKIISLGGKLIDEIAKLHDREFFPPMFKTLFYTGVFFLITSAIVDFELGSVNTLIDKQMYRKARDKTLIYMILGFLFSWTVVGIILLIAYITYGKLVELYTLVSSQQKVGVKRALGESSTS